GIPNPLDDKLLLRANLRRRLFQLFPKGKLEGAAPVHQLRVLQVELQHLEAAFQQTLRLLQVEGARPPHEYLAAPGPLESFEEPPRRVAYRLVLDLADADDV